MSAEWSGPKWRSERDVLAARVRELEEALRAMIELDSYRPRDGSVNESWERGILGLARAALTPEEPKP